MDTAATIRLRLLERLISTGSIRVMSEESDSPFWYTSARPGPFYINVENIVGRTLAETTLQDINNELLRAPATVEDKARAISSLIIKSLHQNKGFYDVISLLHAYFQLEFPQRPAIISGGERRDWFFSVPLAHLLNVPHLFLFKNSSNFLLSDGDQQPSSLSDADSVVHVSDIINTATSYTDRWIPILNTLKAKLHVTLTVAIRGDQGVSALRQQNVAVISPLAMNLETFKSAYKSGLISQFSLDEISLYFQSPRAWTKQLLLRSQDAIVAGINTSDNVQRSRIIEFMKNDPYNFADEFPLFFQDPNVLIYHG